MEPLDFIARLCAAIPPPRFHMTRFHGVLAPHSTRRPLVVPKPQPLPVAPLQPPLFAPPAASEPVAESMAALDATAAEPKQPPYKGCHPWALLLPHVFAVDVSRCAHCQGRMRLRELRTAPHAIALAMAQAGLGPRPPPPPSPQRSHPDQPLQGTAAVRLTDPRSAPSARHAPGPDSLRPQPPPRCACVFQLAGNRPAAKKRSPRPLAFLAAPFPSAKPSTPPARFVAEPSLVAEPSPAAIRRLDVLRAEHSPSLKVGVHAWLGTMRKGFHPICFCCRAELAPEDGLQVYDAHVRGLGQVAAAWTYHPALAGEDGFVAPEVICAALDCPGQFAGLAEGTRTGLLGRLTARVERPVRAVVIGWTMGNEGRKFYAGTALFDQDRKLCAYAKAVWIRRAQ